MKRNLIAAVLAGAVVLLGLAAIVSAQQPEPAKRAAPKLDRIAGTIQDINKTNSTITVRQRSTKISRIVVYSPETKVTKLNKPGGTLDDLKEGIRIICLGNFDDKTRLVAKRIDIRQ